MRALDLGAEPLDAGSLVVEASAGTGKTFAIAHLYLRLLLEREGDAALSPREILVVTYTRAATAELRTRIRQRLADARALLEGTLPPEKADAPLVELVARHAGEAARVSARLAACMAEMDDAAIFTIHGFCERVLREAAFDSGVDFDRELVERPRVLLSDVVRDLWVAGLADADPEVVRRIAGKLGPLPLQQLAEIVLQNPAAELVPARPEALDTAPRVAALERARETLLASGRPERETLRKLLVSARDAGELKVNLLGDARIARVFDALDRVETSGRIALDPKLTSDIRHVTPRGIPTRKNGTAPSHPLMEAIAGWLDAATALDEAVTAAQLRFLHDFAGEIRAAFASRLRERGLYTFDDLLLDVWSALDTAGGDALAARVRARYPVALVDEFQDTDPQQYEIFRRIHQQAGAPLILIGDPKQSIYSFRGADVDAYVRARTAAGERVRRLSVCYRSDPAVLAGVHALFAGERPFDRDDIDLEPVEPRPGAADVCPPGLELLLCATDDGDPAEQRAAEATAAEIARRVAAGEMTPERIAVLCRKNAQAQAVSVALRDRGLPAVLHGDSSVFDSAAAVDVERIARALAQPGDAAAVRAALATRLLGADAAQLAALGDDAPAWDAVVERFARARVLLDIAGFAVALRDLAHDLDLPHSRVPAADVLSQLGGERYLTDVLHLADLAHAEQRRMHLGPLALAQWIGRMCSDEAARTGQALQDTQIRIESDARAVQLTTVHRSKGLQFDHVYVPFAWCSDQPWSGELWQRFHDGERRCIDLARSHRAESVAEAMQEALRLLYVAVTRARHYCGVLCVPQKLKGSALAARLEALGMAEPRAPGGAGLVVRELSREPAGAPTGTGADAVPALAARQLARGVPRSRRTSSYSGLLAAGAGLEEGRDRDPAALLPPAAPRGEGERIALADFPRGTRAGSLVHQLYEELDFDGADRTTVGVAADAAIRRWALGGEQRDVLVDAVLETLRTPLPGDGSRLADVKRDQRRDELEFTLPVGDPDARDGWLRPGALAAVLERHAVHPGLRAYAGRVAELRFTELAGHLRGFIDLVYRHGGRWFIADYKTTWLGDRVDDYAPARVEASIHEHHYALQYHLYAVALHRHLELRLPGYDPARDLGGVYYLYVRGMSPAHPPGHGIWYDPLSPGLIEALSDLLARPGEAAA